MRENMTFFFIKFVDDMKREIFLNKNEQLFSLISMLTHIYL